MFGVTKLETVATKEMHQKGFKMSADIIRRANDRMIARGKSNHCPTVTSEGIVIKVSYRGLNKNVVISRERINSAYKQALKNVEKV